MRSSCCELARRGVKRGAAEARAGSSACGRGQLFLVPSVTEVCTDYSFSPACGSCGRASYLPSKFAGEAGAAEIDFQARTAVLFWR